MSYRAQEEWLEVRTAARRAGVSVDTIRRRLRANEFPRAERLEGPNTPWRIPLGDLIAAGLIRAAVGALHPSDASDTGETPLLVAMHIAVLEEVIAVLQRQLKTLKQQTEKETNQS